MTPTTSPTPSETFDVVLKAKHYNNHPSGIEAINIVRCLNFDMGCVVKYVMRRHGKEYERSLKSAEFYLKDQHTLKRQAIVDGSVLQLLQEYLKADTCEKAVRFYLLCLEYLITPTDTKFESLLKSLIDLRESGL